MSIAPDALARLEAQVQHAEDCWRNDDFDGALRQYQRALSERLTTVRETGADFAAADLVVMERTADLAVLFGQRGAADRLLEAVRALAAAAGNEIVSDLTQLKRIEVALSGDDVPAAHKLLRDLAHRIGDVEELTLDPAALRRWEQTLPWARLSSADRALLYTRLYLVIGRILTYLGQYGDALTTLDRGLEYAQQQPQAYAAATVVLRLFKAHALLECGELDGAQALLEDRRNDGAASQLGHRIHRLELLGKLRLLRGDFGAAIATFRETCDLCGRRGFAAAEARASVNLSHVLIVVNQTQAALSLLARASAIAAEVDDRDLSARVELLRQTARARATSLADEVAIQRSVTERWLEEPRTAGAADAQPIRDTPQTASFLSFFEDCTLMVHLLLSRGDLLGAAARLQEMELVFGASDSQITKARLTALRGMLLYYRGEAAAAKSQLEHSLQQFDVLRLTPDRWQTLRLLTWCSARLNESDNAIQSRRHEAQTLLDQMSASLTGADRAVFLLNKWTQEEEFLAGQIDELVALRADCEAAPWYRRPLLKWRVWNALLRVQALIDRYKGLVLQRALTRRDPLVDWGSVARDSIVRTWLALKSDQARLAFLVLPDRVLVITTRRFGLDFGVSPVTRIQLRDLVGAWHQSARLFAAGLDPLSADGRAATEQLHGTAANLARQLLVGAALDVMPARIRVLTVVPDDCLHSFPFAAIVHQGRFLVERFAVNVSFESNSPGEAAKVRTSARDLLLVGISRGSAEFPTLPGVASELGEVESRFRAQGIGVRRFDDLRAATAPTRAGILDQLPRSRFFHVACHGVFHPDEPDRSGLLMDPDAPEGVLTVRDIAALDLRAVEHATLSACWSGDHFVVPGRWVIGLPELLWRAGVRSILASLWPLHDALAPSFMGRFYELLNTVSRAEALRRIQLDCLRGELKGGDGIDSAHPAFWAGLALFGSGAAVQSCNQNEVP